MEMVKQVNKLVIGVFCVMYIDSDSSFDQSIECLTEEEKAFVAAEGLAISKARNGIMPVGAAEGRVDLLFTHPMTE
jgi:hypothetical protein